MKINLKKFLKKVFFKVFPSLISAFYTGFGYAQSIVLDPNQNTIFDAQGIGKTARLPLITSSQRISITNPVIGSIVYDIDYQTVFLFDGQNWNPLMFTTSQNQLPPFNRVATDGLNNNDFGCSVSISGDYAIIGASSTNYKGSAYIFVRVGGNWSQQAKLTASDGLVEDYFGSSVSISGDNAIVGARGDDFGSNINQGSAYIFNRTGSTWTQQTKLIPTDAFYGDNFGNNVSIDGDYAIIGASNGNVNFGQNGSSYIFFKRGGTWSQQAKLIASDGVKGDGFGYSVCISGDYAIVGSPFDDNGANTDQGSVYIFTRTSNTWILHAKLTASDSESSDYFGWSVSISGNYVIIGARNDAIGSNRYQGSAYIFVRVGGTWLQQAKLTASDGLASDLFGHSVSISGDYAIVGAISDDLGSNINQGSAYIFYRLGNNWSTVRQVSDVSGTSENLFGTATSINSTGIYLIGAPSKDNKGSTSFGKVGN